MGRGIVVDDREISNETSCTHVAVETRDDRLERSMELSGSNGIGRCSFEMKLEDEISPFHANHLKRREREREGKTEGTKVDLFLLNADILSWFYWFVLIPFPDWYSRAVWSLSSEFPSPGIVSVQLNTSEYIPLWSLGRGTLKETVCQVKISLHSLTIWWDIHPSDALRRDIWTPPKSRVSLHICRSLDEGERERGALERSAYHRRTRDTSLDALVHAWSPEYTLLVQLCARSDHLGHLKRSSVGHRFASLLSLSVTLTEPVGTTARPTSGRQLIG